MAARPDLVKQRREDNVAMDMHMDMPMGGFMAGWMLLWGLLAVALLVLIVVATVWLVKDLTSPGRRGERAPGDEPQR